MVQDIIWKADCHSASQKNPAFLWNPKVHHRVHTSPLLEPILSQLNPVSPIDPYLPKVHLNVILLPTPRSFQWSLALGPLDQNPVNTSLSPMRDTCRAHLILLAFKLDRKINFNIPFLKNVMLIIPFVPFDITVLSEFVVQKCLYPHHWTISLYWPFAHAMKTNTDEGITNVPNLCATWTSQNFLKVICKLAVQTTPYFENVNYMERGGGRGARISVLFPLGKLNSPNFSVLEIIGLCC
jgi:hypothetical protein